MLENKKLYLGSQSPRRKELLVALGFQFETISIQCEENYPKDLSTEKVAGYLSELKARAFRNLYQNEILLTADTVVVFGNKILGKPKNEDDAREMLKNLSGKTHQVYTAISIKTSNKILTETDVANVELYELLPEEIDFYIKQYKPFDKAGAYGVQEWLGMAKISKIKGSFYTIMGLPTALVYHLLKKI